MAKKEKIIILSEEHCDGCEVVEKRLAGKPNIKIIDIKDPEARQYIKGDEIIVPSAIHEGKRCLIRIEDGKLRADCEGGKSISLED